MEMADGSTVILDSSRMLLAPEAALRLMSLTVVALAASLLAFRL